MPINNIQFPTNNASQESWKRLMEALEEIKKQRFREIPINTEVPQEPVQPVQEPTQEERKPLRPRIGVFSNPAYGKHAKIVDDGGTI